MSEMGMRGGGKKRGGTGIGKERRKEEEETEGRGT